MKGDKEFVPVTPAGTMLFDLAAWSEAEAWSNLLRSASHMPYKGKAGFVKRGYTVVVSLRRRSSDLR